MLLKSLYEREIMIDKEKFNALCSSPPKAENGIGTYKEKSVHVVLKHCIQSDPSFHEVPYLGYIADIKKDANVVEIQSAGFGNLRDKLAAYLDSGCRVCVVYPVPSVRNFVTVNTETGELSSPRKSNRCGMPSDIIYELAYIRELYGREGLRFCIAMLEVQERRIPTVKRGRAATRRDERIPVSFVGEILLEKREDIFQLLPPLPPFFTSAELFSALKLKGRKASLALSFLLHEKILVRDESKRPYIYKINR